MARLVTFAALASMAAALVPAAAHARPGDVDATFGVGGQSVFAPPGSGGSTSRGLAEQADGKLLVSGFGWLEAGGSATAILLRLNENGGLDRAFGDQGIVRSALRFSAADPIVLGDGRIVLVGDAISGPTSTTIAAVRLLPDGRPDPSFGSDGLATAHGGDGTGPATVWGGILQSDGRLVLLGKADPPGGPDGWATVAVRLLPDGSLDRSFGTDGWSRLDVPDSSGLVYKGEELAGGRLLIAGEFDRTDTHGPDYRWTLLRLQPDGATDTGFGDDGVAQGYFTGQGGTFGDLAVQPDGRILISGAGLFDGRHGWGIARAMPDGELDPSFGDGGRVAVHPPGSDLSKPLIAGVDDLALQQDGRIVVSGNRSGVFRGDFVSGWALARMLPDGSPDGDFGDAGWSTTAMGFGNRLWPTGLVRTRDGKVAVSGDANDCGQGTIAVVRFHAENADAGKSDAGPAMRTCDPVVESEPDGDLPVEVQCPLTEDVCRGTGAVEIPSADLPVGRKSFRLSGAHRGTLRIRASTRARRLIARPGGVRAEIVYRTKDGDGHRKVTRRKLRLRRG